MFSPKKFFSKRNNRINNRVNKDERSKKSNTDLLNQKKLEKQGIIVRRVESGFSGAAIKLLLDNFITPKDVQHILKANHNENNNTVDVCKFCKKKCDANYICCDQKEVRLYLLNNALQKLNFISSCKGNSFSIQPQNNKSETSSERLGSNKNQFKKIDFTESIPTFERLQKKLDNIRILYPHVYFHQENIIEMWGKDLIHMKQEILTYDKDNAKFIWI